ncbi:MAG: type II toxin-antitoxin system RelE/ParE family toxin [Roseateles sp.]|uniref:type II toxin-antitoxin system RelE/ParE family toxin n=1 Tax=Roseateles sp. TaxID=1971397 RepID=UPI0039E7A17E
MNRSIHRLAAEELAAAFRFYRREAGLGIAQRFLDEFERVARLIDHQPELGTPASDGRRTYPLHDFPYSVIYASGPSGLRILVVRHQHRDPAHGDGRR